MLISLMKTVMLILLIKTMVLMMTMILIVWILTNTETVRQLTVKVMMCR